MADKLTGYPSIDKPWLKYYSKEAINAPLPDCTIYESLRNHNYDHLNETALVYYGKRISYKVLFTEIQRAARAFSSIGVKPGSIVTICSVNVPEVIYAMYALNLLGAVANMVDPRTNTDRIALYMESSNSEIVLTLDKALPRFVQIEKHGKLKHIIVLSPADSLRFPLNVAYKLKNNSVQNNSKYINWDTFLKYGKGTEYNAFPYKMDYPAVIVYTGGTTGVPKGAVLSNDSLNAITVEYTNNGMDYSRGQKFLNIMPPFIAYGVACGLNMPLCIGLTNILIPAFSPDDFGVLINKYKPQHFIGVPSHFEKLISGKDADKLDLSFVKTAAAGGDALTLQSEDKINTYFAEHGCKYELIKGYGMTELGSAVATTKDGANKRGSIGIPLPFNIISVRNLKTREELKYNQVGEFYIYSPSTMSSYINAPEEMQNVFWEDAEGRCWIKTGDIGYVDEDGFIFLQDRMKRMIIRPDGHNVWPSQIESVVVQHPAIAECAVVGMPNPENENGKIPTAFMVPHAEAAATDKLIDDVDRFCKERMPERDRAMAYRIIAEMPMTPVGKVDYRALEQEAANKE